MANPKNSYDFDSEAEAREWAHRQSLVFETDEECQREADRLYGECSIRERDEQR